jgi:DNA-binding transcriptional regulator YiaG
MARKTREQRCKPSDAEKRIAQLEARIEELRQRTRDARKFSPQAIRTERDRLELSAADYAELVGVSTLTIYSWEHGKTSPRAAQLQKWLDVRGIGKREAWERLGYA